MNRIIKNIFGNRFKHVEAYKIKKIKIDLRDITNQLIKYILLKPKEERSNEDIATLKSYILLKTKFIEKLFQDHIDENMQEIIIILSMLNAFYINVKLKDEVIYNINDKAEYFYIVINGGVSVLGTEQIDCEMNSEEYYQLILDFRNNNEKYLLEKTLEENKINFPIDLEDVNILDKILLKIYLLSKNKIKTLKDNPNYIDVIFEKLGLKYNNFGIKSYGEILNEKNNIIILENEKNKIKRKEKEEKQKEKKDEKVEKEEEKMEKEEKLEKKEEKKEDKNEKEEKKENEENEENFVEKDLILYDIGEAFKKAKENEDIIFEKIKNIATDNLCRKYYFLISTPELPISYYRYKEEKVLQELDYFGENEIQVNTNRVISNRNRTELLCFKHDIYNEMILHMKSKFVGSQVDFLLNNFFFSSIYKGFFDKIYLKYFEYSKYFINQMIIEENDPIRYIYFVKTGNVKIYSKRNIIQNHILIELIKNILKNKNSLLLLENSRASNLNLKTLYSELKADFELIKNEIKLNDNIHLMTYQDKQCIGFECFYFGFNSLYTAMAASDKVEVYKISIEKLIKILSVKNKKALYDFALQSEKAIKILLSRLIKMNNMLIVKYSKLNKKFANQISSIVEKAINIIQKRNGEIKTRKVLNSKKIEQKKIEETNFYNNEKENNDIISFKRKSNSMDNNKNYNEKKNKNIKNFVNVNDSKEEDNSNMNIFHKYDLTAQIKIFDQKANSIKEIYKELQRESNELENISKAENKQINFLKRQNKNCQNFFKLSQGERRLFLKSRNNSAMVDNIQYHYSLIPKSSTLYKNKNNNKYKSLISLSRRRSTFKEDYPFNSKYNNYKPYKYDISKSMLANKKIFEYSIFGNNNISHEINKKIKICRYKRSRDVDLDKYNKIKKNMMIINFQDLYKKYNYK